MADWLMIDFLVCFLLLRYEPIGYPVSVHLYFYDDRFQGYLVRQEVQSAGSGARETLEVWAVPQATLVLEPRLKEFERLKNLEVSPPPDHLLRRSRRSRRSQCGR